MNKDEQKKEFKTRCYRYTIRLIRFLNQLPNEPIYREIKGQATRSGTSICANYFEAEAASSKRDYQNFFAYSLKSANETVFWLSLLKDSGLTSENLLQENIYLIEETKSIANIFASSIITMKGKRK